MKVIAQKCLKLPVMLAQLFQARAEAGFYYLIYHSVSNQLKLELSLPLATFRRQLEFLAQTGRVISYDEALTRLQSGQKPARDAFILTFDDGYANFYEHVFPLLRDLKLPAILFVTTGFVETGIPYPILLRRTAGVRRVTWDMLGEMAASGLITLGAHTHTHPNLVDEPEAQIMEELVKPIELIQQRLGITVQHFSYPRALWNDRIETLVAQYYTSAVIGEGHKALPAHFNPYRIPRVPVRRSDGWLFFLAKTRGWLVDEERFYSKLRQFRDRRQTAESK